MRAIDVYHGSDGDVTKNYYAQLACRGTLGVVAVNLFRAHKCSSRAKKYRGRPAPNQPSYKNEAYRRKNWSLSLLVNVLQEHATSLRINWGWKTDEREPINRWVLYIDLPELGQVSFHQPSRGAGPDYAGEWDGAHRSCERILAFCEKVMAAKKD